MAKIKNKNYCKWEYLVILDSYTEYNVDLRLVDIHKHLFIVTRIASWASKQLEAPTKKKFENKLKFMIRNYELIVKRKSVRYANLTRKAASV